MESDKSLIEIKLLCQAEKTVTSPAYRKLSLNRVDGPYTVMRAAQDNRHLFLHCTENFKGHFMCVTVRNYKIESINYIDINLTAHLKTSKQFKHVI